MAFRRCSQDGILTATVCSIAKSAKGRAAIKGIVSEASIAAIEMLSGSEAVAVKSTARQVTTHHAMIVHWKFIQVVLPCKIAEL